MVFWWRMGRKKTLIFSVKVKAELTFLPPLLTHNDPTIFALVQRRRLLINLLIMQSPRFDAELRFFILKVVWLQLMILVLDDCWHHEGMAVSVHRNPFPSVTKNKYSTPVYLLFRKHPCKLQYLSPRLYLSFSYHDYSLLI